MLLESLLQRRLPSGGAAEKLRVPIAIHERPVRGSPAFRPQPILRRNRVSQFRRCGDGRRRSELFRDHRGDDRQPVGGQVNAVVREPRRVGLALRDRREQIDKHRAALLCDLAHCVGVGAHVGISRREIGYVRRRRLFKRHRRDEHEPLRPGRELIEQPVIRRRELQQTRAPIQRLHLPELRDHHCRPRCVELLRPRAKIQPARLLVNRVRFHRHRPKPRRLRGKAGREQSLQHAGFRLAHKIRPACKDQRLAVSDRKLPADKRRAQRLRQRA